MRRSHHSDGSRGVSDLELVIKAMVSFIRYKGKGIEFILFGVQCQSKIVNKNLRRGNQFFGGWGQF